jgi:hypothetical protein
VQVADLESEELWPTHQESPPVQVRDYPVWLEIELPAQGVVVELHVFENLEANALQSARVKSYAPLVTAWAVATRAAEYNKFYI